MNPSAVVETLDVIKDALPCLCPALVTLVIDKLSFQEAEKAFHRGIVPAIPLAAHAADHAVFGQDSLIIGTGILGATV